MTTESSTGNPHRSGRDSAGQCHTSLGYLMEQEAKRSSGINRHDCTETSRPSRPALSVLSALLDPARRSPEAIRLEHDLNARIVGQRQAISEIVGHYQTFLAGLSAPGRPICNLLMLGPTGCGKTRIVEALAEALAGDRQALIKIDCGEFQHSHEIAKLIGSPPGYLGHRETHPRLCQEKLDLYHTDQLKISFVLFDEIEKASDALWNLLLGILDKGTLTLGDNRQVDFSNTMVFMTGNLGTAEAQRLRDLPWGFAARPDRSGTYFTALTNSVTADPSAGLSMRSSHGVVSGTPREALGQPAATPPVSQSQGGQSKCGSGDPLGKPAAANGDKAVNLGPDMHDLAESLAPAGDMLPDLQASRPSGGSSAVNLLSSEALLKQKMERAVLEAAKRKFAPEFLNRLDRVILCHALNQQEISDVLDLEINEILTRIWSHRQCALRITFSEVARHYLVALGFDPNRGARYLKRAIVKHIVQPLSSLLATQQLGDGDELVVDLAEDQMTLVFSRGARLPARIALQQLSARWSAAPAPLGSLI